MSEPFEELYADIGADLSNLEAGIKAAKAKLKDFGDSAGQAVKPSQSMFEALSGSLSKIGAGFTQAGTALTAGLTVPLVGLGTIAAKLSTEFNASMANVATVLDSGTEGAMKLKSSVQDLAIQTGKSTTDMANGLYQVVSAFGENNENIKVLEINARAAAAGIATTVDAINLTSAVTKGYGDTSAEAVQKASDLAFMTVKLGQTTFPELAASMGKVVPISNALGVSQQELFGVMATFTGVTGNAAEVATQLQSVLGALANPSKQLQAAFKDLGVASGEALIQQRGLQGAMQAIAEHAEKTGIPVAKLTGRKEAMTLVLSAAGAQADTFAQKLAQMGDVAGATDEAFKRQTQGVNKAGFAWEQFKTTLEVTAQKIGDALAPALSKLLDSLNPVINFVKDLADGFAKMDPIMQTVIVAFAAFAAAIGPVLLAVGSIASGIGGLISGFTAISAAVGGFSGILAALTGPIGIAIAAVVALGVAYATNFLGIRDIVNTVAGVVWDAMKAIYSAIEFVVKAIWDIWQPIWGRLKEAVAPVLESLGNLWEKHKTLILTALGAIAIAITGPIGAIVALAAAWQNNWFGMRDKLAVVWEFIQGVLARFKPVFDAAVDVIVTAWETVFSVLSLVIDYVSEMISGITALFQGEWTEAWGHFSKAGEIGFQILTTIVEGAGAILLKVLNLLWENIKATAGLAWDGFVALIKTAWNGLISFFTETIPYLLGRVIGFFRDLPANIPGYIDALWNFVKNAFSTGLNFVVNTAISMYNGVKEWISKLPSLMTEIWNNIIDYLKGLPGKIAGYAYELGSSIWSSFRKGLDKKSPSGPEKDVAEMGANILNILETYTPKFGKASKNAAEQIKQAFDVLLASINRALQEQDKGITITERVWAQLSPEIRRHFIEMARAADEWRNTVEVAMAVTIAKPKEAMAILQGLLEKTKQKFQETAIVIKDDFGKIVGELPIVLGNTQARILEYYARVEQATKDHATKLGIEAQRILDWERQVAQMRIEAQEKLYAKLESITGQGMAVIVKLLGDAFGKSLGETVKFADGLLQVIGNIPGKIGDKLREGTNKVLDWVNRIDQILQGLHKIWNRVPDGLDGVFKSISSILKKNTAEISSAVLKTESDFEGFFKSGSKSVEGLGESATESTSKMGTAFAAAGAAFSGFITGLSVGSATGSKALGALAGAAQGALQGFAVAGPVGAVVGGIGGLIGGLFSGGKSAAQKEQERLQLEAMKQDIAKTALDLVNTGLDGIKKALDAFDQLRQFGGVGKRAIESFMGTLRIVITRFVELSTQWKADFIVAAKEFAENMLPIMDAIGAGVATLTALAQFKRIPQEVFEDFFAALLESLTLFLALSENFEFQAVKIAAKLGKKIQVIMDTIGSAVNVFLELAKFEGIPEAAIIALFVALTFAVAEMERRQKEFQNFALNKTKNFAQTVGKIIDALGGTLDFFKELLEFKSTPQDVLDAVFDSFDRAMQLVDRLKERALEGLGAARDFVDIAIEIGRAIADGLAAVGRGAVGNASFPDIPGFGGDFGGRADIPIPPSNPFGAFPNSGNHIDQSTTYIFGDLHLTQEQAERLTVAEAARLANNEARSGNVGI